MLADRFHQVRKWKRRCPLGAEQLPDGFTDGGFLEFFLRVARGVTERSALGDPRQQLFFVKPIQRGHHRGIGKLDVAGIQYLANG